MLFCRDVYKRQFLNTAVLLYRILVSRLVHVGQRRLVDIEKRADFSVVDTLEPVSYTHLDVYKRQV